MAHIITPHGESQALLTDAKPADGKRFRLHELQKVVDGYIDVVRIPHSDWALIVDDEGLLKERPLNVLASLLAGQPIVGTVLLCAIDGEDFVPLPEAPASDGSPPPGELPSAPHEADFRIERHGHNIVMITPLTGEARRFMDTHVELESWQRFGEGFAVDTRLAGPLTDQLVEKGFVLA